MAYVSITISVFDEGTNAPLPGAMVYVNSTSSFDPTQSSVITNNSGAASFQIPVITTNGGMSAVQVSATGYENQSVTIDTQTNTSYNNVSFPMTPSAPAAAPITLQFQPAVPGISWQIADASGIIASGVSQNDGSANSIVPLASGSYVLTATQVGYQNLDQGFSVTGQTDAYTFTLVATADPNSIQTGSNTGGSPANSNSIAPTSTATTSAPVSSEFTYPNSDYDKYFTITGARIYIGNLFIDETNMIQYALQDNAVPVFGYSSRFYDALAQGRSLVQGQLALNFVSEGYLYTVMNDYAELQQSGAADQIIDNPGADIVAQILGLMQAKNALTQQSANNPNSVQGPVLPATQNLGTGALQPGQVVSPVTVGTSAETGPQVTAVNPNSQVTAIQNQINALMLQLTPDQVDSLNQQIQQQLTGFDDVIGFANAVYQDVVFDIQIDFGNEITGVKRVRYLENCKLISNEQVVAPDGMTILDSYGFIARRLR